MAVFSKHDSKKSSQSMKQGATIIASGTLIKGDITLSSSLHIDGEIEGIIHSDNVITIGTKGKVNGEIAAKNLVINGILRGSAESDSIEIMPNGDVKGKLTYNELTIEKGAVFVGETMQLSEQDQDTNVSNISELKQVDAIQNTPV